MLSIRNNIAVLAALSVVFVACGETKAPQVQSTSTASQGADNREKRNSEQTKPDISRHVEGKFLDATYQVQAKTIGLGVCNGEANIAIDPGLGGKGGKLMDLTGGMSCFGMKIDFGQLLGGMGQENPEVDTSDNVMSFTSMGAISFQPARPFFPLFISTKKDDLRSLSVSRNITMQNQASGESGTGDITISVTEFESPYQSPRMVRTFKNSLRFENVVSGFGSVKDKFSNMLFDKIEMVISLDPIAIPYIMFQGKIADALAAKEAMGNGSGGGSGGILDMLGGGGGGGLGGLFGGGGGGGGAIIGALVPILTKLIDVKVEFHLMEMEGVSDTSFDDDDSDIKDDLESDD